MQAARDQSHTIILDILESGENVARQIRGNRLKAEFYQVDLKDLAKLAHIQQDILADRVSSVAEAISAIPDVRFPLTQLLPKDAASPTDALVAVADFVLTAAERIAREHGVTKVSRRTEDGNPASRILEVAEELNADMIVTGARGLSDLKALMVGSVSHRLTNTAPMTCVTVR